MDKHVSEIMARADAKGALKPVDQSRLASHLGISVQQLPLSMRGGLIGVFFGPDSRSDPVNVDGTR